MKKIRVTAMAVMIASFSMAAATADVYDIDAVHSVVWFRIKHLGTSFAYGAFPGVTGTMDFRPDKPEASKISVAIKTANVQTFNEQRDEHLRSADFFDAEHYPEVTFESTAWKAIKENTFEITGDLKIRGVTKQVTFQAEFTGSGIGMKGETRAGFEAVFSIQRSDFGMTKYLPTILSDEVRLTISLEGVKQ